MRQDLKEKRAGEMKPLGFLPSAIMKLCDAQWHQKRVALDTSLVLATAWQEHSCFPLVPIDPWKGDGLETSLEESAFKRTSAETQGTEVGVQQSTVGPNHKGQAEVCS